MRKIFFIIVMSIISNVMIAQSVLPSDRRGAWETAGYSSNQRVLPRSFDAVWNVTSYGLVGDAITINSDSLQTLIQLYQNSGLASCVFYFPAGTYIFTSNIAIEGTNGIVLRGAGSDQTVFLFLCPCPYPLNPLLLPDDTSCSFGSLIDIKNAHDVGVENLKIVRVGYPGDAANNILLNNCTSCWIVGVESVKPMMFHIEISGGSHNVVRGCYLQDAEYTGTHMSPSQHTHGYGINVGGGAYCLIEDNICRYLRHGIAFDWSANNNVAGYNYVREGHASREDLGITTYYQEWDIVCHGSNSNRNLIEGNVVDLLGADNNMGAGGPYNTYFRNIAYCSHGIADEINYFGELYLNIVGNVFTKDNTIISPMNIFDTPVNSTMVDVYGIKNNVYRNHFYYAGAIQNCCGWNGGNNPIDLDIHLDDSTYYHPSGQNASPDFFNGSGISWPSIGPITSSQSFVSQSNPAQLRWNSTSKKTVDAPDIYITPLTGSISGTVVYDKAAATPIGNVTITLTSTAGGSVISGTSSAAGAFSITQIPPGTYTLTAAKSGNWGGVNATDALTVARHSVGLSLLTGVKLTAGDVNRSSTVNNTDALLIVRRAIALDNSFAAGDWAFASQSVTVGTVNVAVPNVVGLAVGDVNASYIPASGTAFPKSVPTNLKSGADKFSVSTSSSVSLGAVSMRINVANVEGVFSKLHGFMSHKDAKGVSFAWYAHDGLTAEKFDANETIVEVKLSEKANSIEVQSELVDINGTAIEDELVIAVQEVPIVFALEQNYPNPFNPSTQINYSLPQSGMVTLTVYNVMGQEVAKLVNEQKNAGTYSVQWAPKNLASGVYIYRINVQTEKETITSVKRLMLLR